MKKCVSIMLVLLFVCLATSCTKNDSYSGGPTYPRMTQKYTDASKDDSTPSYVAWLSATTYQKMINSDMGIEDGYQIVLALSSAKSYAQMINPTTKDKFTSSISQAKTYFAGNNDPITEMDFSAPVQNSDGTVSIYRIQINKKGEHYFFKQEFSKENGKWKITGDNVADKFSLK